MKKLHAIVTGRVQGVGFRYFVKSAAAELGVVGWVRNLSDGNVEVEAEGPEDTLDEFRQRLVKGPTFSRVVDVKETFSEAEGQFSSFEVR